MKPAPTIIVLAAGQGSRYRGARHPSSLAGEGRGEGELHYRDVLGLCKAATLAEIEAQGWSLNPGRYVSVAPGEEVRDEDFKERLETLNEELEALDAQALELQGRIAQNVASLLS